MIREKQRPVSSGWGIVVILLASAGGSVRHPARATTRLVIPPWPSPSEAYLPGLFIVNPNEAKVLQLFGNYVGTVGTPGFAGPIRFTRRSGSRCGSATSRLASSRSTTTTATRSRSPRWWSGGWWTPPRRCSRSTTTRTTCTCRASRRCATWPPATPTTRTTTTRCRCAATPARSPSS